MASGSIILGSLVGSSIISPVPLTTAERMALTPPNGAIVYDSDFRTNFYYNNGRWYPDHIDPANGFITTEDWVNNTTAGTGGWVVTGNAGADSGMLFDSNTNAIGQVYVEQSSAGPGYATLYFGNSYAFGGQSMFFDARCKVSALSTAAQEYTVDVGFGDQVDATAMAEGIYFHYDRATDGDFWVCKTTGASASTKTVTSVAITGNTYYTLSVAYYGGSVKFYINNTLVATHSTNLTTALVAPKLRIIKTVGATARRLITDYFTTYSFFTTRRI